MSILELINLRKARKAILYLVCIIVTIWLQTMVFSRVALAGAKPFFVPALIVAIGLYEGGVWGGTLGLAAGLGCTLSMAGSPLLFIVLLPVFGFLSGLLAALALLITALLQALPLWIFRGAAANTLFSVALLQALWSVPLAIPAYFVTRLLAGRDRERM